MNYAVPRFRASTLSRLNSFYGGDDYGWVDRRYSAQRMFWDYNQGMNFGEPNLGSAAVIAEAVGQLLGTGLSLAAASSQAKKQREYELKSLEAETALMQQQAVLAAEQGKAAALMARAAQAGKSNALPLALGGLAFVALVAGGVVVIRKHRKKVG